MSSFKKSKGFTLIELIVTLAILSIVLLVTFSMFRFAQITMIRSGDQASVQQGVRMASMVISNKLRTAKEVKILDEMPDETSIGMYNYIYVDGTTIKHRNSDGSEIIDLMKLGTSETQPSLNFMVGTDDSLIKFDVEVILENQSFNVNSEIRPLNLVDKDFIRIDPSIESIGGGVVRYSDPIYDENAIIRIDTLMLDLFSLNSYLHMDGEYLVLEPPTIDPNHITLPKKGSLGSNIEWFSNSFYLTSSGIVYRAGSNEVDQEVDLTATISKGSGIPKIKTYKIRISKLEPLNIESTSMSINVTPGETIMHQIIATGGNPGYTFQATDLPEGLVLDEYGLLTGSVTANETFSVTVLDNHIDRYTKLITPNSYGPVIFSINTP